MSNINKIKLSLILSNCTFWVTSIVFYLNTQNINIQQAFLLLSIYSIAIVVFEYPTGVIGDFFSHKLSIISGFLLYTLSMILFSFSGSIFYYGTILIITAFGASLISGSDTALLHKSSTNFKKDLSQIKFYSFLMIASTTAIGGFLANINLRYPLYASASFFFIASLLLIFSDKYKNERILGNIFITATEGLKHSFSNKYLLNCIAISSLSGAFFLSFKWLYNPLFLELKIPLNYWGIIISLAWILVAAGVRIFKKFPDKNIIIIFLALIVSIFLIGSTKFIVMPLIGIFVSQLIRGYLDTQLDVNINNAITKSVRASIFSFKSLLTRLGSSLIILLFGVILEKNSFFVLMSIFALGILIIGIYPILRIKNFTESKQKGALADLSTGTPS